MPYNIILYFRLPYFMSLIVLYFLNSTSVLSLYIDVVLTLSNTKNKSALVQVMSWHRSGDKPLHDRCWPTYICGTEERCVGVGLGGLGRGGVCGCVVVGLGLWGVEGLWGVGVGGGGVGRWGIGGWGLAVGVGVGVGGWGWGWGVGVGVGWGVEWTSDTILLFSFEKTRSMTSWHGHNWLISWPYVLGIYRRHYKWISSKKVQWWKKLWWLLYCESGLKCE